MLGAAKDGLRLCTEQWCCLAAQTSCEPPLAVAMTGELTTACLTLDHDDSIGYEKLFKYIPE